MELQAAKEGPCYVLWVPCFCHPSPDMATPDVAFQLCLAHPCSTEGWLAPTPVNDEEDFLLIKRGIRGI